MSGLGPSTTAAYRTVRWLSIGLEGTVQLGCYAGLALDILVEGPRRSPKVREGSRRFDDTQSIQSANRLEVSSMSQYIGLLMSLASRRWESLREQSRVVDIKDR